MMQFIHTLYGRNTAALQLSPPAGKIKRLAVICLWGVWFLFFYIAGDLAHSGWRHFAASREQGAVEKVEVADAVLSSQKYVFRKLPLPEGDAPKSDEPDRASTDEADLETPASADVEEEEKGEGEATPEESLRQRVREAIRAVSP